MDHEHKLELWRLESQRLKLETEKLKHAEAGLQLKYEQKRRQIKSTTQPSEPEATTRRTRENAQEFETVAGIRKEVVVIDLSESLSPEGSVAGSEAPVDEGNPKDRQSRSSPKRALRKRVLSRAEHDEAEYGDPAGEAPVGRKRTRRQRKQKSRRVPSFKYHAVNETFPTICKMPNGELAELRCPECFGNASDRARKDPKRFHGKQFLRPGASLYAHFRTHEGGAWPTDPDTEKAMAACVHHWLNAQETDAVVNEREQEYVVPMILVNGAPNTASTAERSAGGQEGATWSRTAAARQGEQDDDDTEVLKVES